MKNRLWFIILLCFCLFPKNILAASVNYDNVKKDANGNYSVNNAVCFYNVKNIEDYPDMPILLPSLKINFKNNSLSSFSGDSGGYKIYAGNVSYSHFFNNKRFECKNELGLRYVISPNLERDKNGQGYYVDLATCNNADCYKLVLDSSKSKVTYNLLKAGESNSGVTSQAVCSFTKISTNASSSNTQRLSSSKLTYTKYSDNTYSFVSEENAKYKVNSGTIGDCAKTETLYLKMQVVGDKINGYDIVNSCNENLDNKCVIYRRSDLPYSSIDPGMKQDGSSSNESSSSEPEQVDTILDFNMQNEDACNSYLGSTTDPNAPAYYLHFAFNLMKYIAILMLFALTVFDFFKAASSDKDDSLKKAFMIAIKRFIIVVIIFFIPIIVEFVFKLFGIITDSSCL